MSDLATSISACLLADACNIGMEPLIRHDVRLSPLVFDHINLLACYAFNVPDSVVRKELRLLRKPGEAIEEVA